MVEQNDIEHEDFHKSDKSYLLSIKLKFFVQEIWYLFRVSEFLCKPFSICSRSFFLFFPVLPFVNVVQMHEEQKQVV